MLPAVLTLLGAAVHDKFLTSAVGVAHRERDGNTLGKIAVDFWIVHGFIFPMPEGAYVIQEPLALARVAEQ